MFSTHDYIQFVVLATVNNTTAKTYYKLQILMIIMLVNSAVLLYITGITSVHIYAISSADDVICRNSVNKADTEHFNQLF